MRDMCWCCDKQEGTHQLSVVELGRLEPLHTVWYCETCYRRVERATKTTVSHRRERARKQVVFDTSIQPYEAPASIPTPKFIGDKPLPDVQAV